MSCHKILESECIAASFLNTIFFGKDYLEAYLNTITKQNITCLNTCQSFSQVSNKSRGSQKGKGGMKGRRYEAGKRRTERQREERGQTKGCSFFIQFMKRGYKIFGPSGLKHFFNFHLWKLLVMDVLTFVCLCSVEIIRKRFQGMPVIQFIKFPANVEYFVFILVSERKTNRQTCHKMLFSMSSMSTTLTQRVPFRCLVLPSHGVNFCPHVSSILIHKEVFHLKETPELHTSRVRFATSF